MSPQWPDTRLLNLPVITPFSFESCGGYLEAEASTLSSTLWPTANLAYFYPWRLEYPVTLKRGGIFNGSSVAGNVDIGVYDYGFNRLMSHGGTAQAGTAVLQDLDLTDTTFLPGHYWLAIVLSSTSGTVRAVVGTDEVNQPRIPLFQMATAYPLPTTATPAKATSSNIQVWSFGFTQETAF